MSWGMNFLKNIYLDRQVYRNIHEVDSEILDIEEEVERFKSRIKMYASANIKDVTDQGLDDDPIYTIETKVDELLNEIQSKLFQLKDLRYLHEYFEKKDQKTKLKNSFRIIFNNRFIGLGKNLIVIKFK